LNKGSIANSYFENGFIYFQKNMYNVLTYYLNSITFINNTSYRGTFMYIENNPYIGSPSFSFNNIKFINNKAENFGGVLYSEVRNYGLGFINFENCSYENNTALLGKFQKYFIFNNNDKIYY